MHIRTMTRADIPFGMQLSAQNGWNQLEPDWRRQIDLQPDGCFLAEEGGVRIGTSCACIFGDVAWIALVLVDKDRRGHGAGTALMRHTLAWLDARGVPSVRLDATPLGRPLYEKLGFRAEFTLHRYAGTLRQQPVENGPHIRVARAADMPDILALDRHVTGTDRSRLLTRLFAEHPHEVRVVSAEESVLAGFLAARPGARAWQVGPSTGDAGACRALLLDACHRHAGHAVFLDVPADHPAATEFAESLGLTVQRPLLRMGRGPAIREEREAFWSGYGPEKG